MKATFFDLTSDGLRLTLYRENAQYAMTALDFPQRVTDVIIETVGNAIRVFIWYDGTCFDGDLPIGFVDIPFDDFYLPGMSIRWYDRDHPPEPL